MSVLARFFLLLIYTDIKREKLPMQVNVLSFDHSESKPGLIILSLIHVNFLIHHTFAASINVTPSPSAEKTTLRLCDLHL